MSDAQTAGHPPHAVSVMGVFAWLVVLTVAEIGVVFMHLPKQALVAVLIGSALVKAGIVAMYFMHMKFEGRWIWWPVLFCMGLGAVFVLGLVPDCVIGYWK